MKKLICIAFLALMCVFVLCSCGEENFPFTASAREFLYDGYVYVAETSYVTYRRADSTEAQPLCFDPLCMHAEDCMARRHGLSSEIAVGKNRAGEICVYYTDELLDHEDIMNHEYYLCCINMTQGTKTVVTASKSDMINRFWLYGNDIYLNMQQSVSDENGNIASYGNNIQKISVDGTGLTALMPSQEASLNICAITEIKGETVIYWIETTDLTLYASPADFSEKTKLAENIRLFGSVLADNMLYYPVENTTVTPAYTAPAHPADNNKNTDGTHTVYAERTLYDYYRLDLTKENAVPEWIYSGVNKPTVREIPIWTNGEKLYIIPYAPKFLEAIAADRGGIETGGTYQKNGLEIDYITARSGETIVEIDLASGEWREIPTPCFDARRILGVSDGRITLQGYVVDLDRIREKLNAEGVTSNTFTFEEIQTFDIQP